MNGDEERTKDFLRSARAYFRMGDPKDLKQCAMTAALISIAEDTRRIADLLESTTKNIRQGGSRAINVDVG